jgi:flagellar biosynthesis protein FlhF
MKIKRYMAVSMREALAQVRVEQGPDAVILSSRRVEEGIEVIAAVDYDEALFVGATLKRAASEPPATAASGAVAGTAAAVAAVAPAPAAVVPVHGVAKAVAPAPIGAPSTPLAQRSADTGYLAMRREFKELRDMLQGEFAQRSWHDQRLREPLQARVLEQLNAMDIAPDIAMMLAKLAPRRTSVENPASIPLALLTRHLPVVDRLSTVNGGVIALVGPTGAGKTTTIAKLAARWSMEHGSQDLALVSTDGYRIGAREQLMTYARLLGAPMHVANSGRELREVLARLKSKKLILIDTAGMGPRDVRLSEQLAALQLGAARARVLLALPAQGEGGALEEIVQSFARVTPAACVLTKVDEAASLGAVLSTTLRHKLKIAYLCTGQRVPEDLHAAHRRRVWLIRVALQLKARPRARASEPVLARPVSRVPAHA